MACVKPENIDEIESDTLLMYVWTAEKNAWTQQLRSPTSDTKSRLLFLFFDDDSVELVPEEVESN